MDSIIKPKSPTADVWVKEPCNIPGLDSTGYPYAIYSEYKYRIRVISAVEVADDENKLGPEYHISISQNNGRCSSNVAKWVKEQFNMQDSTEDNHTASGLVRHFWMPIAENLIGHECPCKETETAVKEDKGDFVWRGINE